MSSTSAVLLHSTLLSRIGAFDYATVSGFVYTFFRNGYSFSWRTLTLTVETLKGASIGSPVLIDDGSGTSKWRAGTLVASDLSGIQIGGQLVSSTARAAVPIADNTQSPAAGDYKFTGLAANGSLWFANAAGFVVVCSALQTVGDLSGSGSAALVNTDGSLSSVATRCPDVIGPGTSLVAPASMANLVVGMFLSIDQGADLEGVFVEEITTESFAATFTKAHTGSTTPWLVSGVSPRIGGKWTLSVL